MNIENFKFEGKIYGLINYKVKNKGLSKFLEKVIIHIFIFIYSILSVFLRKKCNKTCEEARKEISQIYKKNVAKSDNVELNLNNKNIYDLSILIPVYNSEDYIEECLTSVINQKTYYKYEIVIVNDGSTDRTEEILNKYIHIKNINIVKQENKGIAISRNICLNNSHGRYIMFVDADDILNENAVEILMNKMESEKADIVQGSFYKINRKEKIDIILEEKKLDKINNQYDILKIPGYPWGKIIKKELFCGNGFPSGYSFEDTIIPYKILNQCKKVVILNDVIYGYRINEKGATKKLVSDLKCLDTVLIVENILEDMKLKKIDINYELYLFTLNCQFSYITYYRIKNMDINIQKNIFIIMCDIINRVNMNVKKEENFITKNMEKSFKNQNFQLWKYTSILLNFLK